MHRRGGAKMHSSGGVMRRAPAVALYRSLRPLLLLLPNARDDILTALLSVEDRDLGTHLRKSPDEEVDNQVLVYQLAFSALRRMAAS
jgi:hypothetical protein